MSPTLATTDMLTELSACAHRLGVEFAAEAQAASDVSRKLELFRLFDRCFFSVRVSVALQLRLRREAAFAAREDAKRAEGLEIERRERPESEPTEIERAERPETYDERDRDRETERATLPLLLSTLSGIAADAAALPGPPPADLPALTELLARAGVPATPRRPARQPPRPGRTGPTPAAPKAPLRARLSAGAALAPISPGPTISGASPATARPGRRATGPPRR